MTPLPAQGKHRRTTRSAQTSVDSSGPPKGSSSSQPPPSWSLPLKATFRLYSSPTSQKESYFLSSVNNERMAES